MDLFYIILIVLFLVFAISFIIVVLYLWFKMKAMPKTNKNIEPIQKIKAIENKDKTPDVNNQKISESNVKDTTQESEPKEEPSVSDKDFDQIRVSETDENETKDEKTWSTITCTGSREIRSPQSVPANELMESFSDYSSTNFRSPQRTANTTETESKQSNDSEGDPMKKKSAEDSQSKSRAPKDSQTKPKEISVEIPDHNSEETVTKSVEN